MKSIEIGFDDPIGSHIFFPVIVVDHRRVHTV
jgi:hypothetical protein